MIIVAANTRGRTPTRGKSYARPLSSGMEISRFHQGAWRGIRFQRDLISRASLVMRAVAADLNHIAVGLYPGTCFSCDDTKPVRNSFSRLHRALAPFQSSARAVAYVFQVIRSFRSPVCKYETGAVQGVGNLTQATGNPTHERH